MLLINKLIAFEFSGLSFTLEQDISFKFQRKLTDILVGVLKKHLNNLTYLMSNDASNF